MSGVSITYHFSNTKEGQSGCRAHSGAAKVQNPNALETLIRNDLDGARWVFTCSMAVGRRNGPYSHICGAYAYVSNGSDAAVNFDNFLVQYQRGKLRQINDYYPTPTASQ